MLPLLPGELAAAQVEFAAVFCDKSCQVWRDTGKASPGTYGSSSSGRSNTAAYTQQSTTTAGLAQMSEAELMNYNFEIEDKAAWRASFPIGADIQVQDHLVIEGQTLEVHILLTPESYPMLLQAVVAELKP